MDETSASGFAVDPPAFDAAAALAALQRALRDLGLSQRGPRFELRGRAVADVTLDGAVLRLRLARQPALTPDWDLLPISHAAEQRQRLDEIKRRLARWAQDD